MSLKIGPDQTSPTAAQRILLGVGAAGLLCAMAADGLAVLGRHAGFSINGAIELFQVCAVVALTCAILLATLGERHAVVDLLAGRLSVPAQRRLAIAGRLASLLAFLVLTIGSAMVSFDLWPTHEMTEQLAIPLAGFRLFWLAGCVAGTIHSATALVREVAR